MKKLVRRIFGMTGQEQPKSQSTDSLGLHDTYDHRSEHDRLGLAYLIILQNQLELLGFEIGKVPAQEPYISPSCRGALAGTAIGVLEAEAFPVTTDRLIDANIATFGLVFGDLAGREIAMQTANDIINQEADVAAASEWAREDVLGYYSSGGETAAMGFYVAAKNMI